MAQSLAQFGQTIKAKHPEYADMSDEDVATKVLAKYPQYEDMVEPQVAGAGPLGTPQPNNPTPQDMGKDMKAPALGSGPQIVSDLGVGALKGAGRTANNIGKVIIPDAAVRAVGATPPTKQAEAVLQPTNTAQKVGGFGEQAAEFFLPGPAEEAIAAKAAPLVGKALPALKMGLAALGSGTVNAAQGGSFGAGALAGGVGSGVSQGIAKIAPALAESALKVTGNDKTYGRTVGRAILDDTRGVTPSAVEDSARAKIGELTPQVEQIAADAGANGSRGSLVPARDAIAKVTAKHTTNRAVNSAAELQPLQDFLQKDAVTGLPLSGNQTPTGLLQLKRGVDADFVGNWNPNVNSNNQLDAAKAAYGKLASEFHIAAPGTQELDQRVSSLIPVINRAQRAERGAGIIGETMNRFRTPTGALVGAAGGGVEGYHRDGIAGALAGAGIGALLPSVIASPTTQLTMARIANLAPRLYPPVTGAGLQLFRSGKNPDDKKD